MFMVDKNIRGFALKKKIGEAEVLIA